MSDKKMAWTGERYTPGSIDGDITVEHLHRYHFAKKIISNKNMVIVDIASGEGYGTFLLSKEASFAYGIDISEDAINFSKSKYVAENLEYKVGSCSKIPLPDKSVDAVISFETIEHHDQHVEMMSEIKRILKDEGLLIISSPDKKNFTEISKGENHFHIKELYFEEFKTLLSASFKNILFYGQKLITGSLLSTNIENTNSFTRLQAGEVFNDFDWSKSSIYHLAIASNQPFKPIANDLLESDWLHKKIYDLTISKYQIEQDNKVLTDELQKIHSSLIYKILTALKLLT